MDIERTDHEPRQISLDDNAAVLSIPRDWHHVQHRLLTFARTLVQTTSVTPSWRDAFATCLRESTRGQADIYWDPCPSSSLPDNAQLAVVSLPPRRYGVLVLTHGYLISPLLPTLLQDFANICALVLALAEHLALVQHQLAQLPTLSREQSTLSLTRRERQVLLGLARGETEARTAANLGIQQATVHTHRQRLYQCLDVHTSQEAVLRAFSLQLLNWLDLSPLPEDSAYVLGNRHQSKVSG